MHGRHENRLGGLLIGALLTLAAAGPVGAQTAGNGTYYLLGDGQGGWTVQPLDADGLAEPPHERRRDDRHDHWQGDERHGDPRWDDERWRYDGRWRDENRQYRNERDGSDRDRWDRRERHEYRDRRNDDWRDDHRGRWNEHHDERWDGHRDRDPRGATPIAPDVEVRVDGLSVGGNPPRADDTGPDQCHQTRRDAWSTDALDCPQPEPPERRQSWSTSP